MLPTNIAASIGIAQLDKLTSYQSYRQQIWNKYQEAFSQEDWIICPVEADKGEQHSYFTYALRVERRDELARYLLGKDIYSTLRYHPLHLNKLYESEVVLPNSEQLNEDCLSIPLHPNLTEDQVSFVIETGVV